MSCLSFENGEKKVFLLSSGENRQITNSPQKAIKFTNSPIFILSLFQKAFLTKTLTTFLCFQTQTSETYLLTSYTNDSLMKANKTFD